MANVTGIAIVIPVFTLMLCLLLLFPILIGVYVYRDAGRRGMNAALWTLVSVLAPSFIGLIIYLIVRSDHSDQRCPACAKPVKSGFAVCPYCGAPLKEHCPGCDFTLEPGWLKCPGCGQNIPENIRNSARSERKKDKGLRGLLLAVILLPLCLCVMMFLALCGYMAVDSGYSSSSTTIFMDSPEQVIQSGMDEAELEKWLAECDAAGPGFYILEAQDDDYPGTGEAYSSFLLYCSNDYRVADVANDMGGWFTKDSIEFICVPESEDNTARFAFFEYISEDNFDAKVTLNGRKADVTVTGTDFSTFGRLSSYAIDELYIEVYVDESAIDIYSVSCDFYADDELIWTESALNADESSAAGSSFDFFYPISETDNITYITVSACDEEGNSLFSPSFDVTESFRCVLVLTSDGSGAYSCKIDQL